MNKQNFKKQFPDVCIQDITFDDILSRSVIESKVLELVSGLDTGLITYESSGRKLKVFTSDRLKASLENMVKGYQVLDQNTGLTGTVTSDQPFICGCEMCVRVDFGKSSDVYACTYFL